MQIGIDCLAIKSNYKGGINSYLLGLIDGFKSLENNCHTYVIFCTTKNSALFLNYQNINNFKVIIINDIKVYLGKYILALPLLINSLKFWELTSNLYNNISGITKLIQSNCDVLYTPTTVLNFFNLKIPTILSMHDIQQHHYPEFFSKITLRWRYLTFKNSAKFATYFQASSEFIKDDLLNIFKEIQSKQIIVISEGVNIEEFKEIKKIDLKKEYNIEEEFIFFPAQLWKHKNHITVLKALKELELKGIVITLIMTGDKYSASNDILDYIKNNNMYYVKYLGKIDFKYLVALYQQAKFMITATLYESSSLPILEAAASGTAIIASKTPPNIEMAENIKINLFETLSVSDCSSVIKKCWLDDINSVSNEVRYNNDNIPMYSWSKIAQKYSQFLEANINVK